MPRRSIGSSALGGKSSKRTPSIRPITASTISSVEGGRRYVKAYVEYIHYVEQVYEAAKNPPEGRNHEAEAANIHEERK